METRRHNGFGVDLIGAPTNLDKAMAVLNAYESLVKQRDALAEACEAALAGSDPLGRNKHGGACASYIDEPCDCWIGKLRAALALAEGVK